MAGRRAGAGLVVAGLALSATGCGLGSTKTVTAKRTQTVTTIRTVTTTSGTSAKPCTGAQLTGTFAVVPGSAGAGQIAYELTVKNASRSECSVRGIPAATLLDASGAALPTRVRPAETGKSARIVLQPGASAMAQARFSPDIAGEGDSQSGACQPRASTLQVTPVGGGVMDAAIKPPTSVCQQGTLTFEAYGYAG